MVEFSQAERTVVNFFVNEKEFIFEGSKFQVIIVGKPRCEKGEPKTDVYVKAVNDRNKVLEFKISIKRENADFLENKTTEERAEALFGSEWDCIIRDATNSIRHEFENRKLIFKEKGRRTGRGSITLGWKYELLNKPGGDLSAPVNLTRNQIIDVYAGTNLPANKRNSRVDGEIIQDSGIANFILINDDVRCLQDVINNLLSIEEYIDEYPDIYFACKALNYRTFEQKYDGNRPLAVSVYWSVENGRLKSELNFDHPLIVKGNEVASRLMDSLGELRILNTDDIYEENVWNYGIVNE